MPTKKQVKQGDTIGSLAFGSKLLSDTVWKHGPNDAELKTKRERDRNILLPGDPVEIPDVRVEEVSKPDAKRYRFKRKTETAELIVRLLDGDHKPHKGVKCEVELDGEKLADQTTDGEGKVKIEDISPGAKVCKLTYQGKTAELRIGHLDPIDTPSGHLARLKNLMYVASDVEGKIDSNSADRNKLIRDAAAVFQSQYRESKTDGVVDEETQNELEKLYGC